VPSAYDRLQPFVLARVWWAGVPLHEDPLCEFVIRRDATLSRLVYGLLDAIGFHEDHLWCLAQPTDPVGQRRVGSGHVWRATSHWRHIHSPAEADIPHHLDDDAEFADEFTVDELAAGESDEAWLLFDYGDHHTFRFKFHNLHTNRAPVRVIRAAVRTGDLELPEPGHVGVLRATEIEQYPYIGQG
jgi:hypothetical protein